MNHPSLRRPWTAGISLGALLLTAAFWVGCQDAGQASSPVEDKTVKNTAVQGRCSDVLEPVCGADGVSYRNDCAALMIGETTVASQGLCPGKPLDGWTSLGEAGRIKIAADGADSARCGTPDPIGPDPLGDTPEDGPGVEDGVTPDPDLTGFDASCKEVFPQDIAIKCADTLEPVCSCDGKTYRNSCYANGVGGVYAKSLGACEGKPYTEE